MVSDDAESTIFPELGFGSTPDEVSRIPQFDGTHRLKPSHLYHESHAHPSESPHHIHPPSKTKQDIRRDVRNIFIIVS